MTQSDAPKPAPTPAQLHLTGPLGEQITVSVTPRELYPTLERWGRKGFFSGEVPAGGFQLPHENEHDFNWALIGGRSFSNNDGEICVACRGHVYKRREFEAQNTGKKMPAAIKYSRGARPTDPPHLKEGDEAGVQYVTLIQFRSGRRNEAFAVKPDDRG